MPIIQSVYTQSAPQQDGRWWVNEVHTTDEGVDYRYEWLCEPNGLDPQMVLEERANVINTTLAARAAAKAAVQGTEVPIDPYDFLDRILPEERVAIRDAAVTDPYVADFIHLLDRAPGVRRSRAMTGLLYLQSKGLLTAARVAVIGDF